MKDNDENGQKLDTYSTDTKHTRKQQKCTIFC